MESDRLHREPLGDRLPREMQNDATSLSSNSTKDEVHEAVHTLDTTDMRPINEFRRSAVLTAAAFAMICASTSYAFNLFSGSLQSKYSFDSRAMSTINSVGMVFAYFLTPYGIIYDYFGPLPIYVIACTFFSLGALLMGLTFQGVIVGSVAKFCVYNALLSLGSQLFDLASVVTCMSIFPTRRGWVIAILKTLMGLGSAIIGSIQLGFFINSPANYFYFLIALVVVVGISVMLIIKLPSYVFTGYEKKKLKPEEKAEGLKRRAAYLTQDTPRFKFYFGISLILILVIYLPTATAVLAFTKLSKNAPAIFGIVTIVLSVMFLFMLIPFPAFERMLQAREIANTLKKAENTIEYNSKADIGSLELPKGEIETDIDYIAPQYQTTFIQSLHTVKFWCIFYTLFCGLGAEFVIIFNARFIYAAVDGKAVDSTVGTLLTVLNGAGSALGRMAMSFFEAYSQRRKAEDRIPITVAFYVPTSIIIISIILFLTLSGRSLLIGYAIAALGNGFCGSIVILVVNTMYAKDAAKHYNYGINALVPAAILINRLLYGEWYAVQAEKYNQKVCLKKSCVMMPLLVMIGLNVTGFFSITYVHLCYSRFSREVLAERRRIKEEALLQAQAESSQHESSDANITKPMNLSGIQTNVYVEIDDDFVNDRKNSLKQ